MTFSIDLKRAFPYLPLYAYGFFLCSYFVFDEYSDPYRVFARGVFILGFVTLGSGLRGIWGQPLFRVAALYLAYLLASGFWSEPMDWFRLGQKFTISLYIISFMAITHFLVNWHVRQFERMLRVCVLFAALSALVSMLVFYRENPFPATRLEGLGALTNVNIFANVYGIFALLAMSFSLRALRLSQKVLFMAAVGLFICFAWFGQSRTAFVSMLISLLFLAVSTSAERRALYALILLALVGMLLLFFPDVVENALLRGQGLRPLIWAQAWEEIKAAPIFGHGLISVIAVESGKNVFETTHNAYLQVLWQGGAIGLGLFLLLLALSFRCAWRHAQRHSDYTILCILLFTACIMMTGVDTLIARPRDQWMVFWFPLALLLAYQAVPPRTRPSQGRERQLERP